MDKDCLINPSTGRAVKKGSKVYKKIDSSAKQLQATVKAKLTKPPPKPSPPPPKPKAMKPKPSPKMDDDNWFIGYIQKDASQILQSAVRRSNVMKNKNK